MTEKFCRQFQNLNISKNTPLGKRNRKMKIEKRKSKNQNRKSKNEKRKSKYFSESPNHSKFIFFLLKIFNYYFLLWLQSRCYSLQLRRYAIFDVRVLWLLKHVQRIQNVGTRFSQIILNSVMSRSIFVKKMRIKLLIWRVEKKFDCFC